MMVKKDSNHLAYALDSWNNNILFQGKIPPRNKQGLKSYTKDFGKRAKEFGLLDITFADAIAAYRSLPYSLPEFQFAIPEEVKPLLQGIDQQANAIAEILDYFIKDGKPERIYSKDHPYAKEAELLIAYREVCLELFPMSPRLNHLFPSVAVLWGCLIVANWRWYLAHDSNITACIFGENLPHSGISKRKSYNEVSSALDHLRGEIPNKKKGEIVIGSEPYIIFGQELKSRANNKQRKSKLQTPERLMKAISALNQHQKNDPSVTYFWLNNGKAQHTAKDSPKTLTDSGKM